MTLLRSTLVLACAATLAVTAVAQNRQQNRARQPMGITDIMRSPPPPVAVPPANARPTKQTQRVAEYIVALVNSEPITNTEVSMRLDQLMQDDNPELKRMPRDQLLKQVLDQMIGERAQLQLAKEQDIRIDSTAIDQGVALVARQNNLSVAALEQRIAQAGLSKDEFRNNIRKQLLLTRLRERELEPKIKVSDAEIDQYLQDQRRGGGSIANASINIGQILIAVPEKASAAQVATAQKRAQDITRRAQAGEDFAKLAAEYSDAPGAKNDGGAFGLRQADRYPTQFVQAVQPLQVGGVAAPLRSNAGFHVLKLLARESGGGGDAVVRQTQVRHILLRVDGNRSAAQANDLLKDFKRRIQGSTATFESLAREYSQDPGSARNGGELGWSVPNTFVPEFEEAMNQLSAGQISEPISTRYGVHLIQVEGRRDAKLSPEDLRAAARNALRDKKMDEAYATWAQEVRNRAYVEYREAPQT